MLDISQLTVKLRGARARLTTNPIPATPVTVTMAPATVDVVISSEA